MLPKICLASLASLALAAAAVAQQSGIEVRQLGALDPMEVGVAENGLGDALWAGSTVQTAINALEGLPGSEGEAYRSPARANLVALALLSGGAPPQGGRGNAALAALRADRLLAASGAEAVFSLLERTPGLDRSPDLARLHAETGFAIAAGDAACRTANGLVIGRDQPYWLRARAFCHALNGEDAAAELTADLARTAQPDNDFDGLLYAVTIGSWTVDRVAADTGLDWALAAVSPPEGRPVVNLTSAPDWLIKIAEASAAQTELTADPALALEGLSMQEGAVRDDLLDQLIRQEFDRMIAAQALGIALREADARNDFMRVARRYGRQIATLPVSLDTIDAGGHFALAALAVGDLSSAQRWRRALEDGPPARRASAAFDPSKPNEPAGLTDRTQPVFEPASPAFLVGLDLAFRVARNDIRSSSTGALIAARFENNAAGLGDAAGLAGLGAPVPADFRLAVLNGQPQSVSPALIAMDAAALSGARAETALLAAQVMEEGPAGASALELMRITSALDRVGLREIALSVLLERLIVELA
ncbi:hypothetical protein [Hyphobacterium sp.]|uniref:hypothetical protein n=1 Tax=Hyphobacterium sp. TaxID=2004662 RepID=UPI003BACA29F